jgi:hypothetical protein
MEKKTEPRVLSDAELNQVHGGKISHENNGGHTPGGSAFGVPHQNPADKEPPGHNKGPGNS